MKGLYRYLSPFAPDQSGATAVFFGLGGLLVILDAGGCTGNVCGFDEPRWFTERSAIYSAGLRDLDAILGRDEKLMEKIQTAAEDVGAKFLVLVGTPVPSVIATDYAAITRLLSKRMSMPAIYLPTTGMETYEIGEQRGWEALQELVAQTVTPSVAQTIMPSVAQTVTPSVGELAGGLGVFGALPLNMPPDDSAEILRKRLEASQEMPVHLFAAEGGLEGLACVRTMDGYLAVSPAAVPVVKKLSEKNGKPYQIGYPVADSQVESVCGNLRKIPFAEDASRRVLLLHQQVLANSLREKLLERMPELAGRIDVASFFRMEEDLMEGGDAFLEGETELLRKVRSENYVLIAGDPLFRRAIFPQRSAGTTEVDGACVFVSAPQRAVSGEMFGTARE